MSSYGGHRMRLLQAGIAFAFLLAFAGTAFAHHSGAMFDRDKTVELVGTDRERLAGPIRTAGSRSKCPTPRAARTSGAWSATARTTLARSGLAIHHAEARRSGDRHGPSAAERRKGRAVHFGETGRRDRA